jgi:hypothetical protein
MIDPNNVQAWTTILANVTDVAMRVKGLLGTSSDKDAEALALDFEDKILELRRAGVALGTENLDLRLRLAALERVADLSERVIPDEVRGGVKLRDPKPSEPQGACCLRCWEVERALRSLYMGSGCRDCCDVADGRMRGSHGKGSR